VLGALAAPWGRGKGAAQVRVSGCGRLGLLLNPGSANRLIIHWSQCIGMPKAAGL